MIYAEWKSTSIKANTKTNHLINLKELHWYSLRYKININAHASILSLHVNLSYKELMLPVILLADYQFYYSCSTKAES